jgi:hypothetical protein
MKGAYVPMWVQSGPTALAVRAPYAARRRGITRLA